MLEVGQRKAKFQASENFYWEPIWIRSKKTIIEPLYVIHHYFCVWLQSVKLEDATPCIQWRCICKWWELPLWPSFAICSVCIFPWIDKRVSTCHTDIETSETAKPGEQEDANKKKKKKKRPVGLNIKDLTGTNMAQRWSHTFIDWVVSWWEELIGWYFLWAEQQRFGEYKMKTFQIYLEKWGNTSRTMRQSRRNWR